METHQILSGRGGGKSHRLLERAHEWEGEKAVIVLDDRFDFMKDMRKIHGFDVRLIKASRIEKDLRGPNFNFIGLDDILEFHRPQLAIGLAMMTLRLDPAALYFTMCLPGTSGNLTEISLTDATQGEGNVSS